MAPLPPDSTARVKIEYATCGHNHTVQIRYAEPNTIDDVIAAFNDFTSAIEAGQYLSTFVQATAAASGSNVFNPVGGSWPVEWGTTEGPEYASAQMVSFVGRSLDGRRTRITLFGAVDEQVGNNYRASSVESSAVEAAVAVLNGAEGVFLTINGFQPIWSSYANLGPNAYWRNKIR